MKAFFQKYKHAWVLLYAFLYLPWFFWLESRANLPYHVIHVWLDDKIPFVEYFIVPLSAVDLYTLPLCSCTCSSRGRNRSFTGTAPSFLPA